MNLGVTRTVVTDVVEVVNDVGAVEVAGGATIVSDALCVSGWSDHELPVKLNTIDPGDAVVGTV